MIRWAWGDGFFACGAVGNALSAGVSIGLGEWLLALLPALLAALMLRTLRTDGTVEAYLQRRASESIGGAR